MARTFRYSTSDAIDSAVKRLLKAGWRHKSSAKHHRIASPDGKTVLTVPKSPSDPRTGLNWLGHLRQMGVEVPA